MGFLWQKQTVGIPGFVTLTYVMLTKGCGFGGKCLSLTSFYTVWHLANFRNAFFYRYTNKYSKDPDAILIPFESK